MIKSFKELMVKEEVEEEETKKAKKDQPRTEDQEKQLHVEDILRRHQVLPKDVMDVIWKEPTKNGRKRILKKYLSSK